MMKAILLGLLALALAVQAEPSPAGTPMPLWPEGAPGALGTNANDIPTLTAYLPAPEKATGAAMVILPGGGYGALAPYEGADYARWFVEQGIAGYVVKYRLGTAGYHHPSMLQDAMRAVRTVRYHAADWKLDPHRIGIIGSSAGGHLAATVMTHIHDGDALAADPIDKVTSRPDLGILCYPVITMGNMTHGGSRKNLLGDNPSAQLIDDLSNERRVTTNTPPCFLFSTDGDTVVPVENTMEFAAALRKAGVHFEMHIYERGQHGIALGSKKFDPSKRHPWTAECQRWLKEHKFEE